MGKGLTERRSLQRKRCLDMPDQITVHTSLQGLANKAASQPNYRFRNLYGLLNEDLLLDSWALMRQDAALGVDRVSAQDYEQDLAGNVQDLVTRLKEKRYHAKLVQSELHPESRWQATAIRDTGHGRQAAATGRQTHSRSHL